MAARLSKENWVAIRHAYEAGSSARQLARQYGVTTDSIHKKSHAQGWRRGVEVDATGSKVAALVALSASVDRLAAAIEETNCRRTM